MMRTKLTLTITTALLAMLWLVPGAGAQLQLFASTPAGAETGFVLGGNNIISLRGSVDAPSGGQWVKVRQVSAGAICPTPLGSETVVHHEFMVYLAGNQALPAVNVSSGVRSSERDTRFCIYSYFDVAPGGEHAPNVSYHQDATFRNPADSLSWFSINSATSPELPFYAFNGSSETGNPLLVAFVSQRAACPANFPGGPGALNLGVPATTNFSFTGDANVQAGFWRACGYFQIGAATILAKDTTFSRTPRGGWVPKYKFKRGTLRRKGGRWELGTVTCRIESACRVTLEATYRGKLLARGTAKGKAGSKRKIKLKLKPTSAGKKAVRRKAVKVSITATSVIDFSEVDRRVKVRLR